MMRVMMVMYTDSHGGGICKNGKWMARETR